MNGQNISVISGKHLKYLLQLATLTLREKCPYLELFCFVFTRIRTEYGQIQSISLYSVRMRENVDQTNSEYGHFSRSVIITISVRQVHYRKY